jgi:hypothetical protein
VDKPSNKDHKPAATGAERRRVGQIVHDERGNASVAWQDAPTAHERTKLEILGEGALQLTNDDPYNPYAQRRAREAAAANNRARKDLRKLSEWIKLMRELEARKKNDGKD